MKIRVDITNHFCPLNKLTICLLVPYSAHKKRLRFTAEPFILIDFYLYRYTHKAQEA